MQTYHVYLWPSHGTFLNYFKVNNCADEQDCLKKLTAGIVNELPNDMQYYLTIEDFDNMDGDDDFNSAYQLIDDLAYLCTKNMKISDEPLDRQKPVLTID